MYMDFKHLFWPVMLSLAACQSPEGGSTETPADQLPEHQVELSAAQLEQFDLQLDTLQTRVLGHSIQVNGMIDVPPQNRALIHPPLAAYVQDIRVKVGQWVRKGDLLAVLEHPEMLEVQRRYLDANAQLAFLAADFARQEELARDQATAQKQLDKARADLSTAQAGAAALEAQVLRLGIDAKALTANALQRNIRVTAPFDGYITSVDAQLGQFVAADQPLLGILNKEHLHVELELFERDLPAVRNGQQLSFQLTNMPGKTYTGDVFLIGQTLDAVKRTVMVHGHIDQEDDPLLRPGLFVSAELLEAGTEWSCLPEAAVVRTGSDFVGFRYLSPGKFERVLLQPGYAASGQVGLLDPPASGSLWAGQGAHRLEAAWRMRFEEGEADH